MEPSNPSGALQRDALGRGLALLRHPSRGCESQAAGSCDGSFRPDSIPSEGKDPRGVARLTRPELSDRLDDSPGNRLFGLLLHSRPPLGSQQRHLVQFRVKANLGVGNVVVDHQVDAL